MIQGKTRPATFFLQPIIDRKILPDQGQAATQGVRGLLGRESFQTAVADAIVLAEVTVDGLQTVVGLAHDEVRLLALGVALPTNNPLMSKSCFDIVDGGATGTTVLVRRSCPVSTRAMAVSLVLSSSARSQLKSSPPCW